MAEEPKSNLSLADLANSFWTPTGLKLPNRELVEAVTKAKLPCVDAFGSKREVVIMTIASEFAFQSMFDIFLHSLANITFPRKDGSTDNLARHTVTNIMSINSAASCRNVSDKYGAYCVNFGNPSFSSGNFWVHSNEFYGIGFTKTATILDALTLNVDVLFLDADQVFFRNPLPYLLARETDIMVSGDCHNHGDAVPEEKLPGINNNIGFVYFRPTAMVTRAMYNWALHLATVAKAGGKPWDQTSFAPVIEWLSADVSLRHMSMAMLHADYFPYLCMGHCGCDLQGVPYYSSGRVVPMPPEGWCPIRLMQLWYNYHMPCAGNMNEKGELMRKYSDMYQAHVGPINSRSDKFEAL